MGLFRKKDKKEEEDSKPDKYDRSFYIQTTTPKKPATKKTVSDKTKGEKTMAEKKTVAKTAAKPVAKPKTEAKPAAKKEVAKPAAEKKPAAPKEKKVWHITKREEDNKWAITREGSAKATKLFNTKKEAEEYVKTLSANNEGSRVVTHKKDGKFQKK